MQKFSNNKSLFIKDLEDSGFYNQDLLNSLRNREFYAIMDFIPEDDRANIDIMEPLLYAVRNELGTYEVFKYYQKNLQNDIELASEIIVREPELIKDTPISLNRQFILDNLEKNPKIIEYMNSDLKTDKDFISQISSIKNPEIMKEIVISCVAIDLVLNNPELGNDLSFMDLAIDQDVNVLKYASEEIKNNKEFLKTKASQNEKVIDYVVNNVGEFGLEGIKGVRESSREFTVDDCMSIIKEMATKGEDARYQKVIDKVNERGADDPCVVRWITAMAAQRDDLSPDLIKRVLNYSVLTAEKTRQDITENGEMHLDIDSMQELITPKIIERLSGKLESQGIKTDDSLQQKIDRYKEFYDEYHEKFVEQKMKAFQEEQENIQSDNQKELEDTKLSFKLKLAQFLKKNNLFMKIPFINKFVNDQINILPEPEQHIPNDNTRKNFMKNMTNNGELQKLPPLNLGKGPNNHEHEKEENFRQ